MRPPQDKSEETDVSTAPSGGAGRASKASIGLLRPEAIAERQRQRSSQCLVRAMATSARLRPSWSAAIRWTPIAQREGEHASGPPRRRGPHRTGRTATAGRPSRRLSTRRNRTATASSRRAQSRIAEVGRDAPGRRAAGTWRRSRTAVPAGPGRPRRACSTCVDHRVGDLVLPQVQHLVEQRVAVGEVSVEPALADAERLGERPRPAPPPARRWPARAAPPRPISACGPGHGHPVAPLMCTVPYYV